MHGIYMDHAWNLHEPCMEFTWTMHGIYMDHAWNLHGPCMEFTWTMHGIYLDHAWEYMVRRRGTFSLYLVKFDTVYLTNGLTPKSTE